MHVITTIAAIATPPGRGGVSIVRISGSQVAAIAHQILGKVPAARYAQYGEFFAADRSCLDQGIALYFPAPHSFTGEDVLELQGHGGPVVMNMLLERVLSLGACLARPGEFSERAFLNNKIDLAQAEAIADLIDANSTQAARNAITTLQGEFSKHVSSLVQALIHLRVYVEAGLDFPEEELGELADEKIIAQLTAITQQLNQVLQTAKQGVVLREGLRVVIVGAPNVGKSSLFNRLTGRDSAIVTAIPGTTRDVLHELIELGGLPLHIIDTAGLRESPNPIEQEGIRRARQEMLHADVILLMTAASDLPAEFDMTLLPADIPLLTLHNKIDLVAPTVAAEAPELNSTRIFLSVKTGVGLELLEQHLKQLVGYQTSTEGQFLARQRHLEALHRAQQHLSQGQQHFIQQRAGELLAADLAQAQQALNDITGKFSADALLGEIFASFCIGK